MSEIVTEAFWLVFFSSILLSAIISRFSSILSFIAGIGLIFEAYYLTSVVSVSSINMFGVVLLGLTGAMQLINGWKGT